MDLKVIFLLALRISKKEIMLQVQWLLENYECFEGVSLPRSTMYSHYLRHCTEHKLDPVNAASFGKLIRSVFLGLRTRRLGTRYVNFNIFFGKVKWVNWKLFGFFFRGNSKYHYYGIRIKPGSSLTHISEEPIVNTPRTGGGNNKRFKQSPGTKSENQYESSGNHNTSPQVREKIKAAEAYWRRFLGQKKIRLVLD